MSELKAKGPLGYSKQLQVGNGDFGLKTNYYSTKISSVLNSDMQKKFGPKEIELP